MGHYITGVEEVALAVVRINGSHYFEPGTRRFFNARVAAAFEASDGVLYVKHSTAQPRYGIPRLHSVTAFTSEGTFHLVKDVSQREALRVFEHARKVGIAE